MLVTASPVSRILAFLLDSLLIAAWAGVLAVIGFNLLPPGLPLFATPFTSDLTAFALLVFPALLYFALGESSRTGATLGKRAFHIRVTDLSGRHLSRPRSFLRSAVKLLPWQIAHTSLFHIPGWPAQVVNVPPGPMIGFILVWALVLVSVGMMIFTRFHRALHDFAAGSLVVKRKE